MRVDIKKIIDLRMKLHRMPELAFEEEMTSLELKKFFLKLNPTNILEIGKTAFAAVFDSAKVGKTIVFRAEMDALAIKEPAEIFNKSLNEGISHKCGHDGHMAVLCGLAEAVSYELPKTGKVVFLFQAAEETLQGSREVLEHKDFSALKPDYIFGFHNLPSFEKDSVIFKKGNFTSATNGVTIKLTGKPSHASTPDKAINPTIASVKILQFLFKDIYLADFKDYVLSTPVFTQIGKRDFSTTPSEAEIRVTLRAYEYSDLDKLIGLVQDSVMQIAKKYNLKYKIEYSDDAPPVLNDEEMTNTFIKIAKDAGYKTINIKKPFKWTDDFGYYTIKYKGFFFGYGMGDIPNLHNNMYDFDDNRLLSAIKYLYQIYKHFYN